MNWLLIIAILILIWRIAEGIHRGMVKEIVSFVSLVVLSIAIALVATGIGKYFEKDFVSMVMVILMLLVLCIVHRLLSLFFFSAKLIAKLPVIHSIDKLLGAVIGVLETILLIWTVYSLIMAFGMGMLGEQILEYARGSQILRGLYKYNLLQTLVEFIAGKLNWLPL